jgi:hypothetical protein
VVLAPFLVHVALMSADEEHGDLIATMVTAMPIPTPKHTSVDPSLWA